MGHVPVATVLPTTAQAGIANQPWDDTRRFTSSIFCFIYDLVPIRPWINVALRLILLSEIVELAGLGEGGGPKWAKVSLPFLMPQLSCATLRHSFTPKPC